MAMKALKCPNCDANIHIDDDREFGFCNYCGAQIQIREVVEVRYTGSIQINDREDEYEKKMDDATAFMKMEEYHKAEQAFYRIINEYPGRAEGYEMLICTITRNHKVYIKENYDRVIKLSEKMLAVASPERKNYYEALCASIHDNFDRGLSEQMRQNNLLKVGRRNKQIKESTVSFCLAVVLLVLGLIFGDGSWWLPVVVFFAATVACSSLVMIVVCNASKKALLREENESWH